ncbi:hypothetical protein [Halorubrum coriense]|uniref:hypothetical protein n=1 Tax=Halorubrum coriense TaxID=64713 RepID=UPI000677FD3D|nr:hypothetical protein [Halorubrum coriense]
MARDNVADDARMGDYGVHGRRECWVESVSPDRTEVTIEFTDTGERRTVDRDRLNFRCNSDKFHVE